MKQAIALILLVSAIVSCKSVPIPVNNNGGADQVPGRHNHMINFSRDAQQIHIPGGLNRRFAYYTDTAFKWLNTSLVNKRDRRLPDVGPDRSVIRRFSFEEDLSLLSMSYFPGYLDRANVNPVNKADGKATNTDSMQQVLSDASVQGFKGNIICLGDASISDDLLYIGINRF
jgi:hypothetical protein